MTELSTGDIVDALRRGPATLDALAARLGEADRDTMWWAIGEAIERGAVVSSRDWATCGPDGLCGSSAPTVLTLATSTRSPGRPSSTSTSTSTGAPEAPHS